MQIIMFEWYCKENQNKIIDPLRDFSKKIHDWLMIDAKMCNGTVKS